jgi:hypothetical protein
MEYIFYFILILYFNTTRCPLPRLPSWEPNRFSDSQEILRISWNPKVHCRIQKFCYSVNFFFFGMNASSYEYDQNKAANAYRYVAMSW